MVGVKQIFTHVMQEQGLHRAHEAGTEDIEQQQKKPNFLCVSFSSLRLLRLSRRALCNVSYAIAQQLLDLKKV